MIRHVPDAASLEPAPGDLAHHSTDHLRRELERRDRSTDQLRARREVVASQLAAIEAELELISPAKDAARRGILRGARAVNACSLPEALAGAVEPGTVVSPAEAVELVREAGYVSNARTFGQVVAAALARHAGFVRVDRGQYRRLP